MNKEDAIVNHLLGMIESGKLQVGSKIPSEYELAEICGVNKGTANKAVTRLVERGWVERRGGAGGSVLIRDVKLYRGTIAYRCSLLSAGIYSARMMRGAQRAAAEHGYTLQYHESVLEEDAAQQKMIIASGAVGVLSAAGLGMSGDCQLPYVHIGSGPESDCNFFYPDRAAGAAKLAELAIANEHLTPALLLGEQNHEIIAGVTRTYLHHGIKIPSKCFFPTGSNSQIQPETVWSEIRHVLPECSILFCGADSTAIRMIHYLETIGLRVPEDVSVTGFGTMMEYQSLRNITSAEEFPEHLGYRGCLGLIDLVEGRRDCFQEKYVPEIIQGTTLRKR